MASIDVPFATLFGLPYGGHSELVEGSIVAFGAPLQSASPRRPGAELGPSAIRETSCDVLQPYLASASRTAVDLSSGSTKRLRDRAGSLDLGDLECNGQVSTSAIDHIARATATIVAARGLPVLLGGDHRVFEGLVRGIQAVSNAPAIISLSDKIALPAAIDAAPLSLSTLAMPSTARGSLLCIGVNGLQSGNDWGALVRSGGQMISADELYDARQQALATINDFIGKHRALVCCIDLEVVDSGHAAGTPSVNVGGLTPEQLIALLAEIDIAGTLVGVAVTNVAPRLDARGLSELAATEALLAILGSRLFDKVTT